MIRWGATSRLPNLSSRTNFHPSRWRTRGAAKLSHILCSTFLVLVPAIAHHIFQQELY
jgi:hypothetical protein